MGETAERSLELKGVSGEVSCSVSGVSGLYVEVAAGERGLSASRPGGLQHVRDFGYPHEES